LILLRVRVDAGRREHQANQSKRNYKAQFHGLYPHGRPTGPEYIRRPS
jgi:hypothetical protein